MVELSAADWLRVVRREYLEDYVPAGGSAVKFIVPHPPLRHEELRYGLREAAEGGGFQFVFVDSAATRIHLIDRLFHDVARQLDWDSLAYVYLTHLLSEQSYRLPDNRSKFSLAALAELNERAESLLRQEIRSAIEKALLGDHAMSQEFQFAMIGLCKSLLDPGYDPVASAIRDWLFGDPVRISSLKPALIFQRVARHNARHMFTSLTHWLKIGGKAGLVLVLDITRYAQAVSPAQRDGTSYYSTAAALDAYEVLRQLVDGTDEMEACFIAVITGREFLEDERRGYRAYHALNLRIADEVHDQNRENPVASLVRLHRVEPAEAFNRRPL